MVLIKDDNLPVNKWSLGRITNLVPGTDGKVRVVEIKTNKGNIKRSIGKGTLNIRRAASPLVRLVKAEKNHESVFPQNWGWNRVKSYYHLDPEEERLRTVEASAAIIREDIRSSVVETKSYPTESAAAHQYVSRVYYQVQTWLGNHLEPQEWCWILRNELRQHYHLLQMNYSKQYIATAKMDVAHVVDILNPTRKKLEDVFRRGQKKKTRRPSTRNVPYVPPIDIADLSTQNEPDILELHSDSDDNIDDISVQVSQNNTQNMDSQHSLPAPTYSSRHQHSKAHLKFQKIF
ncbi:uncharacterized protein TNCV_3563831 [Trichonephila clavipes]|nr:uncharacterized protein TNCV_3563831 [Trichonephila clavipes]